MPLPKGALYALAIIGLTQAMSLLDRQILAILAPAIKADLKIGDAEMGLLFGTVFALFYALFSLPLGRLADGWTRTKLLSICLVFWSAATALAGFSSSFGLLVLSRLGVGIGEAATQPAGISLVYDYWPKQRRGFVMAVMASSIALGIGGCLVLGGVAASWWNAAYPQSSLRGWQFAFFVAATPGFLLATLLWFLRDPERGAMDGIPTPPDPHPFRASAQVLGSVVPGFNWLSLARFKVSGAIWRDNLMWLAGMIAAITALVIMTTHLSSRPPLDFGAVKMSPHLLHWIVIGFGLFVLVNFMQNKKVTDEQALRVITRSPTLIWGPLSDRLNLRFPGSRRAWVALFAMAVSPIMSFWVYFAPDTGGFYLRFIAYSLVLTGWMPPLYAIMYDQVLPRMRGVTTSVYLLAMTIIGLGCGPYLVGMISDATGDLRTAMLCVNAAAIPIVILMLIIARRARHDEDRLVANVAGATT